MLRSECTILYGIHSGQLTVEQALESADCLQRTTTNKPGVGYLLRSAVDSPPPVKPNTPLLLPRSQQCQSIRNVEQGGSPDGLCLSLSPMGCRQHHSKITMATYIGMMHTTQGNDGIRVRPRHTHQPHSAGAMMRVGRAACASRALEHELARHATPRPHVPHPHPVPGW